MRMRYLLIDVVILFVVGVLPSSSYAEIGQGDIVGLWLFDQDNDIAILQRTFANR